MHEVSIAQAILDAIKVQMAPYNSAVEARSVAVRYGEFRNVDPDSLQFAFESLRKEDLSTKDCHLELEFVPAIAYCHGGHSFNPRALNYYSCTTCGAGIESLMQGEELDVCRLVLESDD